VLQAAGEIGVNGRRGLFCECGLDPALLRRHGQVEMCAQELLNGRHHLPRFRLAADDADQEVIGSLTAFG
jgi:hypothetical protein